MPVALDTPVRDPGRRAGLAERAVALSTAGPYDLSTVLDKIETAYFLLLGVLPEECDAEAGQALIVRLAVISHEAAELVERAMVTRR